MPSEVPVTITTMEYWFAAHAGFMRAANMTLKPYELNRDHGTRDAMYSRQVVGAVAEFAVAKCLQQYWHGIGPKGCPDVGNDIEVRLTLYDGADPYLRLHKTDPDDSPFVMVLPTDDPLSFTIVGWILGRDGKRPEWWRDLQPGRPCFCVPQSELKHVFDLKDRVCTARR